MKKFISICLLAAFFTTNVLASPASVAAPFALPKPSTPTGLKLQSYVRLRPAAQTSTGLSVFLVEDIHSNLEAQKNIAQTLLLLQEDALKNGKKILVAAEAASGAFNFSSFKQFPDKTVLPKIADYLLKEDLISAVSWFGLTTSAATPIVGVDDPVSYVKNVASYQKSYLRKDYFGRLIDREIDDLTAGSNDRSLRMVKDYFMGVVSLAEAARFFAATSRRPAGPALNQFLHAVDLEKNIDAKKAQQERDAFLASGGAAPLDKFPQLAAYVNYIKLTETLDLNGIYADFERLMESASSNKASARLYDLLLLKKLVSFEMTAADWASYQRRRPAFAESLVPFEDFYRLASARNEVMARNALRAARNAHADQIVLVAGGFHTAGLKKIFEQQNMAVTICSPKLSSVSAGETPALNNFLKEHGALQKLFFTNRLTVAEAGQMLGAPVISRSMRFLPKALPVLAFLLAAYAAANGVISTAEKAAVHLASNGALTVFGAVGQNALVHHAGSAQNFLVGPSVGWFGPLATFSGLADMKTVFVAPANIVPAGLGNLNWKTMALAVAVVTIAYCVVRLAWEYTREEIDPLLQTEAEKKAAEKNGHDDKKTQRRLLSSIGSAVGGPVGSLVAYVIAIVLWEKPIASVEGFEPGEVKRFLSDVSFSLGKIKIKISTYYVFRWSLVVYKDWSGDVDSSERVRPFLDKVHQIRLKKLNEKSVVIIPLKNGEPIDYRAMQISDDGVISYPGIDELIDYAIHFKHVPTSIALMEYIQHQIKFAPTNYISSYIVSRRNINPLFTNDPVTADVRSVYERLCRVLYRWQELDEWQARRYLQRSFSQRDLREIMIKVERYKDEFNRLARIHPEIKPLLENILDLVPQTVQAKISNGQPITVKGSFQYGSAGFVVGAVLMYVYLPLGLLVLFPSVCVLLQGVLLWALPHSIGRQIFSFGPTGYRLLPSYTQDSVAAWKIAWLKYKQPVLATEHTYLFDETDSESLYRRIPIAATVWLDTLDPSLEHKKVILVNERNSNVIVQALSYPHEWMHLKWFDTELVYFPGAVIGIIRAIWFTLRTIGERYILGKMHPPEGKIFDIDLELHLLDYRDRDLGTKYQKDDIDYLNSNPWIVHQEEIVRLGDLVANKSWLRAMHDVIEVIPPIHNEAVVDFKTYNEWTVRNALTDQKYEDLIYNELKTADEHDIRVLLDKFGPQSIFGRSEEQLYKAIRDVGTKKRIRIKDSSAWKGFYPVTDPKTGRPTGRLMAFQKMHATGAMHAASRLILQTKDGRVVLQKNTRGFLDWSAAGHNELGHSPEESALTEGDEELHLEALGINLRGRLRLIRVPDGQAFRTRTEREDYTGTPHYTPAGIYEINNAFGKWNEEQDYLYHAEITDEELAKLVEYFDGHETEEVRDISVMTLEELQWQFDNNPHSGIPPTSGIHQLFVESRVRAHFLEQMRRPFEPRLEAVAQDAPPTIVALSEGPAEKIHDITKRDIKDGENFLKEAMLSRWIGIALNMVGAGRRFVGNSIRVPDFITKAILAFANLVYGHGMKNALSMILNSLQQKIPDQGQVDVVLIAGDTNDAYVRDAVDWDPDYDNHNGKINLHMRTLRSIPSWNINGGVKWVNPQALGLEAGERRLLTRGPGALAAFIHLLADGTLVTMAARGMKYFKMPNGDDVAGLPDGNEMLELEESGKDVLFSVIKRPITYQLTGVIDGQPWTAQVEIEGGEKLLSAKGLPDGVSVRIKERRYRSQVNIDGELVDIDVILDNNGREIDSPKLPRRAQLDLSNGAALLWKGERYPLMNPEPLVTIDMEPLEGYSSVPVLEKGGNVVETHVERIVFKKGGTPVWDTVRNKAAIKDDHELTGTQQEKDAIRLATPYFNTNQAMFHLPRVLKRLGFWQGELTDDPAVALQLAVHMSFKERLSVVLALMEETGVKPAVDGGTIAEGSEERYNHPGWKLGDVLGFLDGGFMLIDPNGVETEAGYMALKEIDQPHDILFLNQLAFKLRHLIGQAVPAFRTLPAHFSNVTAVMTLFITGSLIRRRPYWLPNLWGLERLKGENEVAEGDNKRVIPEPHAVLRVTVERDAAINHMESDDMVAVFNKFVGPDGKLNNQQMPRAMSFHIRSLIEEIYRCGWQIVVQKKGTPYYGINVEKRTGNVTFYIAPAPAEISKMETPVVMHNLAKMLTIQYGADIKELPPHVESMPMMVPFMSDPSGVTALIVVVAAAAYFAWKYFRRSPKTQSPPLHFHDLAHLRGHRPMDVLMVPPLGKEKGIYHDTLRNTLQVILDQGRITPESLTAVAKLVGKNNALGAPVFDAENPWIYIEHPDMFYPQALVLENAALAAGLDKSLDHDYFLSLIGRHSNEKWADDFIQPKTKEGKDVFVHYNMTDFRIAANKTGLQAGLRDLAQSLQAARENRLGGVVLTIGQGKSRYLDELKDLDEMFKKAGMESITKRDLAQYIEPDFNDLADPFEVQEDLRKQGRPANWILARPLQAAQLHGWKLDDISRLMRNDDTFHVLIDVITADGLMIRVQLEEAFEAARMALKAA